MSYDPSGLREYFNAYGEKEWLRLEDSLQGRIKYAIHRYMLDKFLTPGMDVLDVGCGPGRFALHIAGTGANVTLADISDAQLEIAEVKLAEAGLMDRVRGIHQLDVVSMPDLDDGAFDLVVCYGSVLSYMRERYSEALRELIRVARPGGIILCGVSSLYGTMRLLGPLDAVEDIEHPEHHFNWDGLIGGSDEVLTVIGSPEFHQPLALFTSSGLQAALEQADLQVLEMATSNPLVPIVTPLPKISANAAASDNVEALEFSLCQHPGLIDAGEHLIAAARRN